MHESSYIRSASVRLAATDRRAALHIVVYYYYFFRTGDQYLGDQPFHRLVFCCYSSHFILTLIFHLICPLSRIINDIPSD